MRFYWWKAYGIFIFLLAGVLWLDGYFFPSVSPFGSVSVLSSDFPEGEESVVGGFSSLEGRLFSSGDTLEFYFLTRDMTWEEVCWEVYGSLDRLGWLREENSFVGEVGGRIPRGSILIFRRWR